MATRELRSVDLQERDDFDRMLQSLARLRGTTVTIDIASDADVLNSAAEFDELAASGQQFDVDVTISTDDPLRQELALIYGLTIVSTPDLAATSILRRPDLQTTLVRNRSDPRPDSHPELVTSRERELEEPEIVLKHRLLAPRGGAVLDPDASFSFVVAPPAERNQRSIGPSKAGEASQRAPAAQRRTERSARRGTTLNASAYVVAGVVIATAIAVLLIGLLAPSARIVLIPETRVISSRVTYAVGSGAAPFDIVIAPTVISGTLSFEGAAPATGQRQVPDATARGMIFLTNPLTHTVEIPAGTAVLSLDGAQEFFTSEEIMVPAADPFGAATFGTAVVSVVAAQAGPDGNLSTGELAGELPSGLFYQNRFPLDGGTLRTETFVASDDLEKLRLQAEQDLRARIGSALEDDIQPGWMVIGEPEALDALVTSFSASAGDIADEVSIVAELNVRASVYDPEEMRGVATQELQRRLGAATPEGFALLLDSMETSPPQAVDAGDAGDAVAFIMTSEATIQAYFDPALKASLADELTGKSESTARRVLGDVEGLSSFSLSYGPDWLPWEPVPRFSNRVSVDIDAS